MRVALCVGPRSAPRLDSIARDLAARGIDCFTFTLDALERPTTIDPLEYVEELVDRARFEYAAMLHRELPDAVVVGADRALLVLQRVIPPHPQTILLVDGERDPEIAAASTVCATMCVGPMIDVAPHPDVEAWRALVSSRKIRRIAEDKPLRFSLGES
jgi:hypothetical protein